MATISVDHFTDPACPFAFSAEPRVLALRWRFGDQLEWTIRPIVLAQSADEYAKKGLTPEMAQGGARMLRERWGMPIDDTLRPYIAGTLAACTAVVAARQYAPDKAEALLRRLRVRNLSDGGMLDDPELIAQAAEEAGIDRADLEAWVRDPDVAIAVRADMAAARDPHPAALAQKQRLATDPGPAGWRYTAPSLLYTAPDGRSAAAAGFQSTDAYEAVLANLAPELERRDKPESAAELLAWAPWPLATAEVAELLEVSLDEAREALADVADEHPAGQDAYWSARVTSDTAAA